MVRGSERRKRGSLVPSRPPEGSPSKRSRRSFSTEFKAQVGLDVLNGVEPVRAIAAKHQVHPVRVRQWKKKALERPPEVSAEKLVRDELAAAQREARLYLKTGRLEMEPEWLKKNLRSSTAERRRMVDRQHATIPVARQCQLLGLPRSTFYRAPAPESDDDLRLRRIIDGVYLASRSSVPAR